MTMSLLRDWLTAHLPNTPDDIKQELVNAALEPFDAKKGEPLRARPSSATLSLLAMRYLEGDFLEGPKQIREQLLRDYRKALHEHTARQHALTWSMTEISLKYGTPFGTLTEILYLLILAAEQREMEKTC